jgi:hypothetical protein
MLPGNYTSRKMGKSVPRRRIIHRQLEAHRMGPFQMGPVRPLIMMPERAMLNDGDAFDGALVVRLLAQFQLLGLANRTHH